jgi:hypothetical protein
MRADRLTLQYSVASPFSRTLRSIERDGQRLRGEKAAASLTRRSHGSGAKFRVGPTAAHCGIEAQRAPPRRPIFRSAAARIGFTPLLHGAPQATLGTLTQ